MSTLTLTFDDDLATQAQEYARRTGTEFIGARGRTAAAGRRPPRKRRPLSPEVAALAGCISLPPGFDYKTALGDALWEKYQ